MKTIIKVLNFLVAMSKAIYAGIVKVLTNKYVFVTLASVLFVALFTLVVLALGYVSCALCGQYLTIVQLLVIAKSISILILIAWPLFLHMYNE